MRINLRFLDNLGPQIQRDLGAQIVTNASQRLPLGAANKVRKIFRRGAYLAENTSQTASVEFVPHRGTNYARSRLPKFVGKARRGFPTVSAPKPVGFGGKLLYSQERQQSQGNRQSAHEHIQDFGFIYKGYLLL